MLSYEVTVRVPAGMYSVAQLMGGTTVVVPVSVVVPLRYSCSYCVDVEQYGARTDEYAPV
jgi:hypothetical protein